MNVVARLAAVVEAHPDVVAIACAGEPALTYRQLWDRAHALAGALIEGGARPGEAVLVHLHKSPEWVAAVLGCWIARTAFVPLDPELPEVRRTAVVAETRARFAIGTRGVAGCRTLDPCANGSPSDAAGPASLDEHAYTIYTSGSTGEPKGVVVSHRGIVDLLDAQIRAFDLGAGDRCLWVLSPSFDASISDVGTALLAGATLHVEHPDRLRSPAGIAELLHARRITHVDLPPSLLPLLPDPPASLRTIIIGGEVCAPAAVRAWSTRVRLVNVYGPTEATVCSTLCACGPAWDRPLLGQPLPGVQLAIEHDELWIGGPAVADGYLARPELTAARFVERDGVRWFRTGDRVRRHADGELEFLGRIDRQPKVAGVLVAPEEIEARLREHPAVADAAVVLERRGGRELLVAYWTVAPGSELATRELRAHLAARLDRRLLPRRLFRIDSIPRGATGKLDVEGLSSPHAGERLERGATAFARLAAVVGHVLELDPTALLPEDDFFELGGDSFAVLELIALVERAGLALTVEQVHRERLLGRLAALGESSSTDSRSCAELVADVRADLHALRGFSSTRDASPGAILLTGATGLLGGHVLAELARSERPIVCIVRAPDDGAAAHRLGSTAAAAIAGDLTAPRLGLTEDRWRALADQVDIIVHCAADLSLAASYAELRASNVGGTANLLALACTGRPKALHHASTLSVFVGSERSVAGSVLAETDALETAGRLYGGYAQSKWAAEYLVREARDRVPETCVYRFGLLLGGPPRDRDWLTSFVRGLAALGRYPDADDWRIDITPIEFASRVLAAGVLGGERGILHVANRASASLPELAAAIERAGHPMQPVPTADWRVASGSVEPVVRLATCRIGEAYARVRSCDLFQATGVTFAMTATERLAAAHGIELPPPSAELLDGYVAELLR